MRVIDDCTCCGLNLTVGLHEKFKLHAIDFLAAIMGHAFRACPPGLIPAVKGRTYDLKSAYKQFAVSPRHFENGCECTRAGSSRSDRFQLLALRSCGVSGWFPSGKPS